MLMERVTEQKKHIMDFLQNTYSHPTAEEVYFAVREKMPHVSKGTIYRNLDLFVKKGLVKEIPGDKKRFDADISMHGHFFCDRCNKVSDVWDDANEKIIKNFAKKMEHSTITDCDIYMRGFCSKCKNSKKFVK